LGRRWWWREEEMMDECKCPRKRKVAVTMLQWVDQWHLEEEGCWMVLGGSLGL
jgi:hypothetical protein